MAGNMSHLSDERLARIGTGRNLLWIADSGYSLADLMEGARRLDLPVRHFGFITLLPIALEKGLFLLTYSENIVRFVVLITILLEASILETGGRSFPRSSCAMPATSMAPGQLVAQTSL